MISQSDANACSDPIWNVCDPIADPGSCTRSMPSLEPWLCTARVWQHAFRFGRRCLDLLKRLARASLCVAQLIIKSAMLFLTALRTGFGEPASRACDCAPNVTAGRDSSHSAHGLPDNARAGSWLDQCAVQ